MCVCMYEMLMQLEGAFDLYVCMYVCMYEMLMQLVGAFDLPVCVYVCMYSCMYVCMNVDSGNYLHTRIHTHIQV